MRPGERMKMMFFRFLGMLPWWSLPPISACLGRLAYWVDRLSVNRGMLHRAVARALDLTWEESDRIIRRNAYYAGRLLAETARLRRLKQEWPKRVQIAGLEHLERARAEGKGVILISAHIGNWEIMVSGLALLWQPAYVVGWRQEDKPENRLLDELRQCNGTRLLYAQEVTAAEATAVLKSGGLLLLVSDHYSGRNEADFLGFRTKMPAGAIHYHKKTGAPIVPAYMTYTEGGHRLTFEPRLVLPEEGDPYQTGVQLMADIFARWIRAWPEQYFWVLKRFDWGK